MIKREYLLTLMLEGPILSQASGVLAFGLDAAMQRYRGEPVLNGTQIRGNICHVLKQFLTESSDAGLGQYLPHWFPDEDRNFEDQRSPLNFDMFWRPLFREYGKGRVRTRIEIEANTGKVRRGALAIAEDLYPSGSCVPFHGSIHACFQDDEERRSFEKWLDKALQWLSAIGANKGVGYGKLLYHELDAREAVPGPQAGISLKARRLRLKLTLDRPFCIALQQSKRDNRFVSSVEIPGHVIKGVLARFVSEHTRKKGQELSKELLEILDFDKLAITHAKPVPCGGVKRPTVVPLNLAKVDDEWQFFTGKDSLSFHRAPEFQPDWKPETWVAACDYLGLEQASPDTWMMVRTAIDHDTGAAKESQLFSMECIDPAGFQWWAEVDLSRVAEERLVTVIQQLQALVVQGLDNLGKTHARARAVLEEIAPPSLPDAGSRWQLTLQSPARLLPLGLQLQGVNSHEELGRFYEEYWREVSGESIKLSAWFTRQRLAGGDYYHHRFRRNNGKAYVPELITEAGSVFVIEAVEGKENQAREYLTKWLRQNLPAWESETEPANWQATIHLPENGFGEIQVVVLNGEDGK